MIKTKIILLVKILLLYIVICDSYHSSYYTSFSIIKQVQNTKHSKSTRLFTAGDVARPIVAGSLEAIDANSLQANNVISRSFTFMKHIWNFTRPHTIVGSAASIICLYLFAVPMQLWTTKQFFHSIMVAMLPSLLMNLYITGLNQVTDVEIDKINKPYLPIAAGQITKSEGIAVIVTSLLASMYLIQKVAWPLQATVIGSGVLGTVYSLPPFRLKRFPLLAAFCILVVRGTLINMGFYLQAKIDVIGASVTSARSIIQSFPESVAATVFFAVFGLVIALMKDVPDIKGDTVYKIKSFSVRLGALRIFRLASNILFALLASGSVLVGITSMLTSSAAVLGRPRWNTAFASATLGAFAYDVRRKAKGIEPKVDDSDTVFKFYMYVWNIFYACYFLLPFIR